MKTLPLSPHLSTEASPWSQVERPESAAILSEIAERLLEWSEIEDREYVHRWLLSVANMGSDRDSVDAIWLYLRLSTGDLGQLTASFSQLGKGRSMSKQAHAQEHSRALAVIARHFPELREAINGLLARR